MSSSRRAWRAPARNRRRACPVCDREPDALCGRVPLSFARPRAYPATWALPSCSSATSSLVALTAKAVWQLADEMLRLRIEKRDLIDKLQHARWSTPPPRRGRPKPPASAKSEFLANMSHELRTPLERVLGFSEIIKRPHLRRCAPDRYAEYGEHIHSSGEHLLGLIGDIFDLVEDRSRQARTRRSRRRPQSIRRKDALVLRRTPGRRARALD